MIKYIDRNTLCLPDNRILKFGMSENVFIREFKNVITWSSDTPNSIMHKNGSVEHNMEYQILDSLYVNFSDGFLYLFDFSECKDFYYNGINLVNDNYKNVIRDIKALKFSCKKLHSGFKNYDCKELGLLFGKVGNLEKSSVAFYADFFNPSTLEVDNIFKLNGDFKYINRHTVQLPNGKYLNLGISEENFLSQFADDISWQSKTFLNNDVLVSSYYICNSRLHICFSNKTLYMVEFIGKEKFFYNDINLADTNFKKVIKKLKKLSIDYIKTENGNYDCKQLGILLGPVNNTQNTITAFYK